MEAHRGNGKMQHDPEKVAVIAVHGVGAPKFGETARRLATLLHRHGCEASARGRYSAFDETTIEVPVGRWDGSNIPSSSISADIEFSIRAINDLDDCDCLAHYRTVKLSGKRFTNENSVTAVDVFELRWADLSSGTRIWSKFVVELYQVYFHLASLGRKTVISAAQQSGSSLMNGSAFAHRCVEWLLPTGIPIANLFFLVPALALVVLWIPERLAPWIAAVLLAAVILVIGLGLLFSARAPRLSMFVFPAAGLAAAAAKGGSNSATGLGYVAMLIGLWFAWVASRWLMSRYQDSVKNLTAGAGALSTLLLFAVAASQQYGSLAERDSMIGVAVWMATAIFLLLQILWLLLFLLLALICILSLAGGVAGLGQVERHALRTGRLGALGSTTLFFLTTVLLWASILAHILDKDRLHPNIRFKHDLPALMYGGSPAKCDPLCGVNLYEFIEKLYAYTVGLHANLFIILIAVALFLAASSVMPSAWYETRPPSGKQSHGSLEGRMKAWLDRAGWMLWPAEIFLVASIIALGSGYLMAAGLPANDDWLRRAGVLLAAAVPLSILLRARLPKAPAAILDIALDVSNWLKERPFRSNPRGRIMSRYIGLLREICKEGAYDRIVVVAHSQGTVISADLFRMLEQTRKWPFLADRKPPIELLTAGCPLRQLYLSRFPVWYGWASNPDVRSLGVTSWVNVYRTGDYVGRDLWSDASSSLTDELSTIDISIGAGAHTHYFDETAPEVGRIIDSMIFGRSTRRSQ
ncbi:hypothetical protein K2O51_33580 (plasmid) [Cupriavidus pinatubonensis]|uniref:hypothetical protein n=1 Tax=Cupriavidus pinatubonensis TaxID=248026 RepID=UPI001C73373B|nr:hypothetical protein [Cupriavidus pinatubonensis]QYY33779.1 hypothetical protein K2O51_33580 [Cupriavidus pinatubonensis]